MTLTEILATLAEAGHEEMGWPYGALTVCRACYSMESSYEGLDDRPEVFTWPCATVRAFTGEPSRYVDPHEVWLAEQEAEWLAMSSIEQMEWRTAEAARKMRDRHLTAPLGNLSNVYMRGAEAFIADRIFPKVPVSAKPVRFAILPGGAFVGPADE